MRWKCPKCEREFGRTRQGHTCAPGLTVEEYFANAKPWERPIFDHVHAHLSTLEGGDLIVDPLDMGILFKNGPMVCQLRAMSKWTALGFSLPRKLTSKKLSRKVVDHAGGGKFFHVINLTEPAEIDDEVLDWLTEAYYLPIGGPPGGLESMVPDDVEDPFSNEI